MGYLDIAPVMAALRERPQDFSFAQGTSANVGALIHRRSRHTFFLETGGYASLRASCGCAHLDIAREQQHALGEAVWAWRGAYWNEHVAEVGCARVYEETRISRRSSFGGLLAEFRSGLGIDKINAQFARHFRVPLRERVLARLQRIGAWVSTRGPQRVAAPIPTPVYGAGDD